MRASDIRYGLERTFPVNARILKPPPPEPPVTLDRSSMARSSAQPKCLASPRSCDLSRGIVVDDKSGTITFHLRHPDPDFLAKLALPRAVAVPPEVSRRRLRSSAGARHRPVHDHPLRHQARRPRTQPVLPRVVARTRNPTDTQIASSGGSSRNPARLFPRSSMAPPTGSTRSRLSTHSRPTRSKPTTQPRSTHPPTPAPTCSRLHRTRRWGAITSRGTAIAHAIDRRQARQHDRGRR